MQESFLEEIGLTKGEVRIYLSLLSLGQTSTGPIISSSGISSSKVYEILEKLLRKGLVSYTIKNKIKYFQATSPTKLQAYLNKEQNKLREKQAQLEEHLPGLLSIFHEQRTKQNAEIYLGIQGIKTMLWDMIEDGKNNEEYMFIGGSGESYEKSITSLYKKFSVYRHEKGLRVKGIAHKKYKKHIDELPHTKMRYVDYPTPSNLSIFQDKVAIISFADAPIGILITSPNIANQFKKFFISMWS